MNLATPLQSQKAAVATESLPLFEAEAKESERVRKMKSTEEIIPQSESPDEEINRLYSEMQADRKRGPQARDKAAAAVGVNPRYVSDAKHPLQFDACGVFICRQGVDTLEKCGAANRSVQKRGLVFGCPLIVFASEWLMPRAKITSINDDLDFEFECEFLPRKGERFLHKESQYEVVGVAYKFAERDGAIPLAWTTVVVRRLKTGARFQFWRGISLSE